MKKLFFTIWLSFMFVLIYGQTWDLEDYSEYTTAESHEGINYPAHWMSPEKYPDFSWDVIPQYLTFKSGKTLSDSIYKKAANYSLIDVNGSSFGFDTWDEGMWYANAKLKSYNPNVCGSFYLNLKIVFPWYLHTDEFFEHDDWVTGEKLRDYDMYNHDNAECRQFWVDVMLNGLADPNVNFGFVDKTIKLPSPFYDASGVPNDGFAKSLDLLYQSLPEDKFLIGNTLRNESDGGNRSAMQVYDGSYLERWSQPHKDFDEQTESEALAVTIQMAREALSKGKIIIMRNTVDDYNETGILTNEDFYVPLAAFLIMVEENAFISFQGSNLVWNDDNRWYTKDLEYFSNYLGPPLGPPVKNGRVYTRSFDNLDVYLDLSAPTLAECTATFTWKGKTGPSNVEVTGINVTPDSTTVLIGSTKELSGMVTPSSASNKNFTWSSSDTSIAKVNSSGVVTATGIGSTFIVVTTEDGGFQDSCVFTVSDAFVTGIDILQESVSLNTGESLTLNAVVSPSNAIIKDVIWSSSDVSVAKVSSNGIVSVVYGGTAIITATSVDGGFTDSCIIKSLADPKPDLTISGYYQLLKSNAPTVCVYAGEDNNIQAGNPVTLFPYTRGDYRTIWEEIDHKNGYYSYQRINTNLCLDAGDGGANNQNVIVNEYDPDNKNQQWEKEVVTSGNIRLKKRDVDFVLNSGAAAVVGQEITLWKSVVTSGNLEWIFVPAFEETNSLTIIVTDSNSGQYLSNVSITLNNETKQTEVSGEAIFSGLYASENYIYTISKDGYNTINEDIKINEDSTLNISLAPISSIIKANNKIDNSFYLSPNPATNELNVELNNCEPAQMSILNNAGQTVMYNQFNNRINTIDISALPAGVYIVKLTSNNQSLIKKFIKK